MTNKIGIFWGSFDPPHMGHIFAALYAQVTMNLDEIWILPVGTHPFGKTLSPFMTRIVLCNLSFLNIKNTSVRTYDQYLSGHCVDLLKYIHEKWKHYNHEYVMLGGSDVSSNDSHYKDKEEILKLCTVARVPRNEYSNDKYSIPNYSSSEIKKLIREGKSFNGLVHRYAENYILENNLYK